MADDYLRWLLAAALAVLGGTTFSPNAFEERAHESKDWTIDYVLQHTVSKQELTWKLELIDQKITECNVNLNELRKEIRSAYGP